MARTLSATKQQADTMYTTREDDLIARQAAYVAGYGVHFQGLDTHEIIPSNGNDSAPDFSRKPTDQTSTWTPADFPPAMPASLAIDCHSNRGFVSILSFYYDGVLWQKRFGYGEQDIIDLSHDWQEMVE